MTLDPYYSDDSVTIYHGDCRDILPKLTADAVIMDPPYGVGKVYGDSYTDTGGVGYWDFMRCVVDLCRTTAPVVAMTHRVPAIREITDWDWLCVWCKPGTQSRLFHHHVNPTWEPIFCWGTDHLTTWRPDTFVVPAISPTTVPGDHPFPKPLSLMRRLVEWLCPAGTVVDPFMGSGTTLRAAKDLGRKAIGIELEERYCEIAVKRLGQQVLAL
jgi:DNA modification methylase